MHLSAQKIINYCNAILSNSEFNKEDIVETDTGDTMLPPKETGYIVVESERAINENNYRVCVPKSWIIYKIREKKVAFEYPAGDEDSIAIRVKNKDRPDGSWNTYLGVILSESESYEEALGYLQTLCEWNSEVIKENSNQQSHEDAVDLDTICGENSEQIEDDSKQKSHQDAVGYLTTCGENSEQIQDNSNQMEPVTPTTPSIGWPRVEEDEEAPVTKPKHSLKLRIVIPKLDQKSEKKKKSEKKRYKKHQKEHSKHKVHKSKHRFMEQLSLTDNITERSSPNSVDTGVDTASCMSCQSNCQSSESSPKSLESKISNSVHSVPETHLNNNNINSYSSKRILLESLDAGKDNNDGIFSEDRQLVENLYINIIRYVQNMKTTVLEMKKSHLTAMENKKTLDILAAKYRIPLLITDCVESEKERKGYPFEEENLQDDEMETQDDEIMENETQATEENDNTSEENLLEERVNPKTLLESESDSQIYTDDESSEDYLPSSPEVVKYRGKTCSKANDIWTLKHPGPGKGLIQIGKTSRIYINVRGLKKAKRICANVKQFARQLFREVFTDEALRTCSMNGFTRPALHYEARNVLKKYALKYGRDVGWDGVEPKELEQNLSKFLINTRRNNLRKSKT